ncbi:protoporphyrinogen oxidase [Micrococcoides hystricis]|uniref:Coproporphyrinogen III oxidase n=1 Tax=Micrococcoides hystricis TaxID=1572761 RepID=A0ABV6P969_9MICC
MSKHFDAIVIGGGISGLTAAWQLRKNGTARVAVLEATNHCGGCVSGQSIAGLTADAGAESYATRSAVIPELLTELGIADKRIEPNPAGAWLVLPEGAQPMPRTGILGIPGDLEAEETIQALSAEGLQRAREDLEKPIDHWRERLAQPGGPQASVAELVVDRMGQEVLDLLVTPVVSGVHAADPQTLDLETVAPGLLERVVAEGSLCAAVYAQRLAAGQTVSGKPGSAVGGLAGGMNTLTTALLAKLAEQDVVVHTDVAVTALELGQPHRLSTTGGQLTAERVVVATDGPTAVDLLAATDAEFEKYRPEPGTGVALVSLVVDHPELAAAPRGTGVLVSPLVKDIDAKALTHASAKWAWIRDALAAQNPDRHLLRLSYGRISDEPGRLGYGSEDEKLIAAALNDAAAITGIELQPADIVDSGVVRWLGALPFATIGHRERVSAFRKKLAELPRVDAVGAWLAGTGLVAVVADVQKTLS